MAFSDFPKNHGHPLSIGAEESTTYADAFFHVPAGHISESQGKRILFAQVDFRFRPKDTKNSFEFFLKHAEAKNDELVQSCRACVHWISWSHNERAALRKELDVLLREHISSRIKRRYGPWLFFIGDQDRDDRALFHVHNHRLICTRYGPTLLRPTLLRESPIVS